MKKSIVITILAGMFMLGLAACGMAATPVTTATSTVAASSATPQPNTPTATATEPSSTPDACAKENLQAAVDQVHRHMREFDDASILASSTPRDQLNASISDLQRIRRESEDEVVPSCLQTLKTVQIQHMNAVIETLLAFTRGNTPQDLQDGIGLARQLHDQYALELGRILGLTAVPATAFVLPSETPKP